MPSWLRTCNWIFFLHLKIFKSSGVPIRLLTRKNSLCQIVQHIMKTLHASFMRFSQIWLSARLNFVNFSLKKKSDLKSLYTHKSFDAPKMLVQRWPPTYSLLLARFSADFKQLQNRNFWTSNRSKPIRVLTSTKPPRSDDHLPMGYSLPDFQLIWSNFLMALSLTR